MKKSIYFYSALLIASFSCLLGCGDDKEGKEVEPDKVSDIVSELNFTTESNKQTITFTTNKEWVAMVSSQQEDASWCSISPSSGAAGTADITVSTTGNSGYEDRNATITIKTGNTVKNLTVTQKQKDAIIISKDKYELSEAGGVIEIKANTNVDLDIIIPKEVNWLKVGQSGTKTLTNKTIYLNVNTNNTYFEREAIIYVKDKNSNLKKKITITQKQHKEIIISEDKFEILEQGGTFEVEIYTNVEYEVVIPYGIYWIRMETLNTRNLDLKKVIFHVDASDTHKDRTAIIQFRDKESDMISEITVMQQANKGIVRRTIHLDKAGTLREYLINYPNNTYEIMEELTLTGEINHHDLSLINLMGLLEYLDISGVSILGGYSKDDEIPVHMFKGLTRLHTIILASITIPSSVTDIDKRAFYDSALLNIYVERDNVEYTDINGVLTNKDRTKLISFPQGRSDHIIPNTITSIGESAFYNLSSLNSITIPESVTDIGKSAFENCYNMTSITIPNSVKNIGDSAFYNCHYLTSITIPNSVKNIGKSAFSHCSSLASIAIPNSVTDIGESAFDHCNSLASVIISNSVESIESYTFMGCTGLTSVTIPNSVKHIGRLAFSSCGSLTSINIPNSVTDIASMAFAGCRSLASVTIGANIQRMTGDNFKDCNKIEKIHIKANVPPIISGNTITIPYKNSIKLYIPKGSKEKYQNNYSWEGFYQYIEE